MGNKYPRWLLALSEGGSMVDMAHHFKEGLGGPKARAYLEGRMLPVKQAKKPAEQPKEASDADSLEHRVQHIPHAMLAAELCSPIILYPHKNGSRMPRLKYELQAVLGERLQHTIHRANSSRAQYLAFLNKEPLKRVFYGACNYNDKEIGLIPCLHTEEAAYFLTGVWHRKPRPTGMNVRNVFAQKTLAHQSATAIVEETIEDGKEFLANVHDNNGPIVHEGGHVRYHKRNYRTSVRLPHANGRRAANV